MKIDFRKKLVSQTGEPLEMELEKDGKNDKVQMTLGNACSEALLSMLDRKDMDEDGSLKYMRWQLAGRIIATNDVVEVMAEDITLIKKRVGKRYGPVVVGPVYDLLEGKSDASKDTNDEVEEKEE